MKILLVKLNHIGDTLLMTPTIRFLREKYPNAEIDVVVRKGCEGVLAGNRDITNLIPVASPEKKNRSLAGSMREFARVAGRVFLRRYDYAFDLSNSDRAKLYILLSLAKTRSINEWHAQLGIKKMLFNSFTHFEWGREHQVLRDFRAVSDIIEPGAVPGGLYINTDVDEAAYGMKLPFLSDIKDGYAVIHPVSRWAFKEWLPDRWAKLADWLKEKYGCDIIFSSGPDAREKAYIEGILKACGERHFSTGGTLSLREFARLAESSRIFLGVDTVAMHIAAAVKAPTVALFGPSSEWSWRPWMTRHELVVGDCSCKRTRKFVCDKSRPYPCMEGIRLERVMRAAEKVMEDAGL